MTTGGPEGKTEGKTADQTADKTDGKTADQTDDQVTDQAADGRQGKDRRMKRSHTGRWIAVAVIVVAGAGIAIFRGTVPGQAHDKDGIKGRDHNQPPAGSPSGRAGGDRPVSVMVARAMTRDVPITLDGLGTVTAFKTVNVHTQVEGRLMRVAFREGQTVRRGELLAEVDPRPLTIQLHQAEAALARDEAQLHGAERNLERYAAVSAERLIPQQQTDDQRALVEQLRGTVQSDRAQIENARLMLSYARITSPIDGVTGVRQIDPGNVVHVADASSIVVVAQMDPIAVIFTLPQDDLPRVARQQALSPLVIEALSRDGDQTLATGRLALIDNQINQSTATMRLKAIFPNPLRVLWPNQFVKTRLRLDVRKGALVIPAVAVQRGPQGAFVYVAGQDDRAEQRPISVDSIEGEQAMLSRGISAGERVVIEGQSQLRPGARIAIREGAPGGDMRGAGAGGATGAAGARGGRLGGHKQPVAPPASEPPP